MTSIHKKINFYELIISIISLGIILELFYAWDTASLKPRGIFPAIKALGFTMTISEVLIFCFLAVGFVYILVKIAKGGSFYFGPKRYSSLILWIILIIVGNMFLGLFIFRNPRFFLHLRSMVFPAILYIIFINMDISSAWEKKIFKMIEGGLIFLTIICFIDIFCPNFLNFIRVREENDSPLYILFISILVFDIAAANLLFSKTNFRWFCVFLLSLLNICLRISSKAAIFGLFISCIILFYIKIVNSRYGLFKVFIIFCAFIAMVSITFVKLPQSVKSEMISVLAWRYLKISYRDVEKNSGLTYVEMAREKDLSGSRIGIWRSYLKEAASGFGIAPHGFGYDTYIKHEGGGEFGEGTHNIIVYFSFHAGIIVGFLILLLIMKYICLNLKIISHLKPGIYDSFTREEIIALFAFTGSIIAISMVSTAISRMNLAWFFWLSVSLLIKRWETMKKNISPAILRNMNIIIK